jgi:hypothetical protein
VTAPCRYEIRVAGLVPPEVLLDFDQLRASVEPGETVMYGPLADQAALFGLLARLQLFGVQVLELRRLRGEEPGEIRKCGGGAAVRAERDDSPLQECQLSRPGDRLAPR